MILRNQLSKIRAGGPRQFAELRDRFIIKAETFDDVENIRSELDNIGLTITELDNAPIVTANPRDTIEEVIEEANLTPEVIREGVQEIREARKGEENIIDASVATVKATDALLSEITGIDDVELAEFVMTKADFGPENLRFDIPSQPDVDPVAAENAEGNLRRVHEQEGVPEVWSRFTRGENAISAIFDTGYARGLIGEERVIETYHSDSVESVYAPAEAHGTMTAGAMAANADEGVPFNGMAPDSDVILVRITDDEGQIRSDIITEAWDWISTLEYDRAIISNHSYGTPLCSGRPKQKFCNSAANDMIRVATSTAGLTGVYASGNEASYCGRRPSGVTNAITGTNSIQNVFTVGALLTNGREAQQYSSHGRGDCAPIADPKPNVSFPIPMVTYYGVEDGWKLKDLSTGPFGSGGGTSHASPSIAGVITLMQSRAVEERGEPMQDEEIKQILEETAELPHRTHINSFSLLFSKAGYDARFGNGKVNVKEAVSRV
jgi:subtilisin family serine protease